MTQNDLSLFDLEQRITADLIMNYESGKNYVTFYVCSMCLLINVRLFRPSSRAF